MLLTHLCKPNIRVLLDEHGCFCRILWVKNNYSLKVLFFHFLSDYLVCVEKFGLTGWRQRSRSDSALGSLKTSQPKISSFSGQMCAPSQSTKQ